MRIGVVIPYFQREGGILARALRSVFAQDLPSHAIVRVIVVDDGSPAPVAAELAALPPEQRDAVTVIAQANAGPGAARNTGLDRLAEEGVDHVAFLDSDDIWKPNHLADAVAALRMGYDCYFCDVRVADEDLALLYQNREVARLRRRGEPGVVWLSEDASLVGVDSGRLLAAHLAAYLGQTSTVVLTASIAAGTRFDTRLRGSGEDHLFWIDLALKGARGVISAAVNVTCGDGVNIWRSALGFHSAKATDRLGYCLLLWRSVEQRLSDAGKDPEPAETRVNEYRRAYSYMFVRSLLLRQRPGPSLGLLRSLAAADRLLVPGMPFRFLSVLPRRATEAARW